MTVFAELKCERCGYKWLPRKRTLPGMCPNPHCRSPLWQRPREQDTTSERAEVGSLIQELIEKIGLLDKRLDSLERDVEKQHQPEESST